MTKRLTDFPLSHAHSDRYNKAKEKLPFDGPLPTFKLRSSNRIYHANANGGRVRTTVTTFHCDQQHAGFLSRLLIWYYETKGRPKEQFVTVFYTVTIRQIKRPIAMQSFSKTSSSWRCKFSQSLESLQKSSNKKPPSSALQNRPSRTSSCCISSSLASNRPPNPTS